MATYVKFQQFIEDLHKGVHKLHAGGDTLKAYLSNTAPSAADDAIKTDLAEISGGNGYTAGGHDVQNDISRSGLVLSLTGVDIVITATGSVGPFRYVVIYNDSPTDPVDPLICYWDCGSEITLSDGESFTIDFGTAIFTNT
jgi:hypothetical protein